MPDHFPRIQQICNSLPGVTEEYPWGEPHWKVAGKIFCGYGDYTGKGPTVGLRLTLDRQEELVGSDPRFEVAPYSGRYGGTTMRLTGKIDWNEVEALIRESHRNMAPKSLLKSLGTAPAAQQSPSPRKQDAPMPRYYIVVGAPENFAITRDRGFTVHGLKARRRKVAEGLKAGDKVIFYLTGKQAWGGIVTVTGDAYEDHTPIWAGKKEDEDYPHRFPIEPDVVLDVDAALPVEPMVPDLEYLRKWPAQHWRLGFQGNVHEIGEADYKTIRKAIEKQAKSGAAGSGRAASVSKPSSPSKPAANGAPAKKALAKKTAVKK
ncbi:MAG TPA: MmcQ/YjbR family DNA-binding protein [bacterium]|nr:MmcQ/YjbR family DNA-binding protein [bacterium]